MGTFERSFEVDGERFELYVQKRAGATIYQLVDGENLPIGRPFRRPPNEETVRCLVHAVKSLTDPAA